MSELPDHDDVRNLMSRLSELRQQTERLNQVQRESTLIRQRIASIRRESPEFPDHREFARLLDDHAYSPEARMADPLTMREGAEDGHS